MPETNENKNIIALYFIFMAAILMNFAPSISIQSWGSVLFIITFIATYISKWTSKKESFKHAHYSYITKTIWIFSLLLTISTLLAYLFGDHTIIENMVQSAQTGQLLTNQSVIQAIIEYGKANLLIFITLFIPAVLYVLFRLSKGMHHARKNRTPSTTSWL